MSSMERSENSPAPQFGLLGIAEEQAFQERLLVDEESLGPIIESKDRNGFVRQGEFERHDLSLLNTVVQSRDEYAGISVFAGNLKESKRLIHPPLVARYDRKGAEAYINEAYRVFGKKIPEHERKSISDLTATEHGGEEAYCVVIAGHRRLRALRMIHTESIIVQVVEDIDPLEALGLQVAENTPKLPKDYERAEKNGELYIVNKAADPELTIKRFARIVGQSEAVARRDMRFYILPEEVKNYVVPRFRIDDGIGDTEIAEQPLMPFTVACQLGRLVEAGAETHDVLFLARRFFEENITSEKEASRRVTKYLAQQRFSDLDMVDLFGQNARELARRQKRHEVARRVAPHVDAAIAFFARVDQAKVYGLSDEGEDSLSFVAAATRLKKLAEVALAANEHLASSLTDEEKASNRQAFEELKLLASMVTEEYDDVLPRERQFDIDPD